MREDVKARRVAMFDYDSAGTRPSIFIPELAERLEVSESTLWRDWGRRRSWIPKLARLTENMNLVAEELTRIDRLKRQVYGMARNPDAKPHQRRLSMMTYKALVELDFGLRGITPMTQAPIMLPDDIKVLRARVRADEIFDFMYSVSPRLTVEWTEALIRMPESLEAELERERQTREKYR